MEIDPNDQVLFDNFVPRYSGIAEVTPNRIVLIGVYLLLAPTGIGFILTAIGNVISFQLTIMQVISSLLCGGIGLLCLGIVAQTHRRYLKARRQPRDILN
jgi:hypothetical protein